MTTTDAKVATLNLSAATVQCPPFSDGLVPWVKISTLVEERSVERERAEYDAGLADRFE